MSKLFTSESVTEGHPDKVCDAISDAILDEYLSLDPYSRVACEVIATTGMVVVMGEVTSKATVDIQKVVRKTIKEIGYNNNEIGFDFASCAVLVALDGQSPDIARGVETAIDYSETQDVYDRTGAGDQGIMFGYASKETDEYMPLAISLAHKLTKRLADVRKNKIIDYLRPDGKSQVTIEYDDDGRVKRVDTVVVSTQHDDIDIEVVRKDVMQHVIKPIIPDSLLDENTKYYINPTGRFVIGGPMGDSGLTGRKIIVDTYGGYAPHGGGAFSGKDPTKVDRSATYYARYAAKNIVASGLADKCQIQLAYAIGKAKPVSVSINTFGTGRLNDHKIAEIAAKVFDFRPESIIAKLDLRKPIYKDTSNYGHFGRDGFAWEKLDKTEELKRFI